MLQILGGRTRSVHGSNIILGGSIIKNAHPFDSKWSSIFLFFEDHLVQWPVGHESRQLFSIRPITARYPDAAMRLARLGADAAQERVVMSAMMLARIITKI